MFSKNKETRNLLSLEIAMGKKSNILAHTEKHTWAFNDVLLLSLSVPLK
jgi:hypothetical protein